jgi:hypothetical protein
MNDFYKIDSIDTQAYLNRAALVGCKNQIRTLESGVNVSPCGKTNFPCSSSVAIILVSGCLPMQVNEDGSKTMSSDDQKIIHRWNYESRKSTWRAENSK